MKLKSLVKVFSPRKKAKKDKSKGVVDDGYGNEPESWETFGDTSNRPPSPTSTVSSGRPKYGNQNNHQESHQESHQKSRRENFMDAPELESDTTASLRSITLGAKAASKSSKSGSHKSGSRIDDGRSDAGKSEGGKSQVSHTSQVSTLSSRMGMDRVPHWLVHENWDSVKFEILLSKCFEKYAPGRLEDTPKIATQFQGNESRLLANLSREFNLHVEDWEELNKTQLSEDIVDLQGAVPMRSKPMLMEPESDDGDYEQRQITQPQLLENQESSVPQHRYPRPSLVTTDSLIPPGREHHPPSDHAIGSMVEKSSASALSISAPPSNTSNDFRDRTSSPVSPLPLAELELDPKGDHPLDEFNEEIDTHHNVRYFTNQRTRRATYTDPKPRQQQQLEQIQAKFKSDSRLNSIREKLKNPTSSSDKKVDGPTDPAEADPDAEKAYWTTAPFLKQPNAEQQRQMENFSPTTDEVFAKLNAKVGTFNLEKTLDENYYGEADEVHYREWTEQQQAEIARQKAEMDAKFEEEQREYEAQKAEWDKWNAQQNQNQWRAGDPNYGEAFEEESEADPDDPNNLGGVYAEVEEKFNHVDGLINELIISPREKKAKKENNRRIAELHRIKVEAGKRKIVYDDKTMKLILSTFYAVNKPEKLPIIDSIVDNWIGDKLQILRTLEEKYNVKRSTWDDIVSGSWIPNTMTNFTDEGDVDQEKMKEIDNLMEQYKHHHMDAAVENTYESIHQADIVEQHATQGIYSDAAANTIELASFDRPEHIDLIVHGLRYKIPVEEEESEASEWDELAEKLKRKQVYVVFCRVSPILANNSLLAKDMVETEACELFVSETKYSKNDETGMLEKWKVANASFDLSVSIQNPTYANHAIYGLQVEVYEMTPRGTEVQLGYVHIPLDDLDDYECYKDQHHLTPNTWLKQFNEEQEKVFIADAIDPVVGVSYCYRQGVQKYRDTIIERSTIDYEIEAVEKAIKKADEEEERILNLTERLAADPNGVAVAIGVYFNELKQDEAEIQTGKKDVDKFKKKTGKRDSKDDDTFTVGSVGTVGTAGSGRRRSLHFADQEGNSMLPAAYKNGELDLNMLKLLESSVFGPDGAIMKSIVPHDPIPKRYSGALKRRSTATKEELKRTGLDGRDSETAPTLKDVPADPSLPGYMKPTIKARESVTQNKYQPNFDIDLRGNDVSRVKTAEKHRARERFKGSGTGEAMRRKQEEEEEKKRFKGFRRVREQGSFNARGGADVFTTPKRKTIQPEDLFREETGKRLADDWKSVPREEMLQKHQKNNPFARD
ncbi:hypothetical protein TrST_g3518 [Triparma strigata]|uniref:Uncharacterized protein n=1 Tax=Triparma strigata TaxID=1606541 RepID=A0A9W7BJG3_9STRA|nr:hypothetical protein TrST_g3518 [Triparma strigata]